MKACKIIVLVVIAAAAVYAWVVRPMLLNSDLQIQAGMAAVPLEEIKKELTDIVGICGKIVTTIIVPIIGLRALTGRRK